MAYINLILINFNGFFLKEITSIKYEFFKQENREICLRKYRTVRILSKETKKKGK